MFCYPHKKIFRRKTEKMRPRFNTCLSGPTITSPSQMLRFLNQSIYLLDFQSGLELTLAPNKIDSVSVYLFENNLNMYQICIMETNIKKIYIDMHYAVLCTMQYAYFIVGLIKKIFTLWSHKRSSRS